MRTVVTGGIRSGKSAHAESLCPGPTDYLATGYPPTDDDPAWTARVAAHRLRRPAGWRTVETDDVPAALARADRPVLLDSLGSWLTRQLDGLGAWESEGRDWEPALAERVDALVEAVAGFEYELVIVTEEVGWSLVSEHRSGRVFTDQLGTINQRIAAVCERVVLVVAGCPLVIKG